MSELLEIEDLSVRFPVRKKGMGWGAKTYLTAVDSVNFAVRKGETLAIVGESGSGKTTAALAIARLVSGETTGQVRLEGKDILPLQQEQLKAMRRQVQVIFQDPYSSLNPRKTIGSIITLPLRVQGDANPETWRKRAEEMARRIDKFLDSMPGRWSDQIHVPDFSPDQDIAAGRPDPFDRLMKEAQQS